jgi:protein-disulfide isomerase
MDKRFFAILGAIIIIFIGVVFFTHRGSSNNAASNAKATSHVEGKGSTGVKLVEYGDYECPACGEYYQPVHQTFQKYKKQIYFQFRNFPLTHIHQNAFTAARAAEAAGLQGKYFGMHDKLYANRTQWIEASDPYSYFQNYARQLGLDLKQFKKDFGSSKVNAKINADKAKGQKLGINATPTFYLDGKKLKNPNPTVQTFSKLINKAIKKKTGHLPAKDKANAKKSSQSSQSTPTPVQTKAEPKKPQQQ